jgi:hypothetical protein
MTMRVTHSKVSTKPVGTDSSRIYSDSWNADHTLTGTLDASQLNASVVQTVTNDTNIQGSISGQNLTFSWGGTLAASRLNGNVVQAVTNDTNVTGSIAAQTITLGWTGTLGLARGGTNANLSATGGASQVLKQSTSGGAVTVGQLAFTDISGQATLSQLPTLTANTVLGSIAGGTPIALSKTQATTLINVFTAALSGAVPAPTTSTGKYLKDDATWGTPAGAGTVTSVAAAGIVTASTNPIVGTGTLNINASITPQGRLTLVTATPVMTTTQSAKTTVFYTPYQGNLVPIYDGTNMVPTAVAEISVATTDTTKSPAAIGASKVNDWFVWSDAGTIRVGHGPDWTSDTVRSAGTALVMVNGILLNNASITNGPAASRGTYVGTTRSNASSQIDFIIGGTSAGGTAVFIGLWNAYNRVTQGFASQDSTATWTYNSTTIRNMNASTGNRISVVRGLDEDGLDVTLQASSSTGGTGDIILGIGLDATVLTISNYLSNGSNTSALTVVYRGHPGIGFHFLQATEKQVTTTGPASMFGVTASAQQESLTALVRY